MKASISRVMALVAILGAVGATDLLAAGRGNGGGGGGFGKQNGTCVTQQTQTQAKSAATARPEGSQRRDGTFMTTGVTANGSTTRPGNGKGLQDGTGLNAAPSVPAQ